MSSTIKNIALLYLLLIISTACKKWEFEPVDFVEVKTGELSNISTEGATISGTIKGLAVSTISQHGFCWSNQNQTPTIDDQRIEEGSRSTNGAFSSTLGELLPETEYFVRAYCIFENEAIYGAVKSFTTGPISLSMDSTFYDGNRDLTLFASLSGVSERTVLTNHGFCWSSSENTPTLDLNDGILSKGATNVSGTFQGQLDGLENETTYYIRPFAILENERVIYGAVAAFRTSLYDFWTRRSDAEISPRYYPVSVTIGEKGYMGLGASNSSFDKYQDFWEYDPKGETWTQKANFGGGPRTNAAAFSVAGKAYVGMGGVNSFPGKQKDFWEFCPDSNIWTQIDSFPGNITVAPVTFTIGKKGYLGTGLYEDLISFRDEFWEYDPVTKEWTEKKAFEGGPRRGAAGFVIGGYGYLGFGTGGEPFDEISFEDFWRYDTITDDWEPMNGIDIPGGIFNSIGLALGNKGYLFGGANTTSTWEFTPNDEGGNWSQKAAQEVFRLGGIGFSIDGKAYVGLGTDQNNGLLIDIWEYCPKQE